jgi:hypothetical protein
VWSGITAGWAAVFDFGSWIYQRLSNGINNLWNGIVDLGKSIIGGIVNGILNAPGSILDALQNKIGDGLDRFKHWLGIRSPSRVMAAEVGKPMIAGIAMGIANNGQLLERALTDSMTQLNALSNSLTLPTLTQNVRLNYLDAPLTRMPALGATCLSAPMFGGPDGAGVVNNYDLDLHVDQSTTSDPQAMMALIGWKLRTGV